jgi:NADH/F420H2 dehydrogenase subunit C
MLPTPDELKGLLEQQLPGILLTVEDSSVFVEPKDLAAVCRYLKEAERFRMDYLANLTAVDYPPDLPAAPTLNQTSAAQAGRMDMVYHLYSIEKKQGPIALKVKLIRQQPTVDSVTPIWRGAEFQEREVYDLFGVIFENHPDLRRILMWDGFEGHPMRKDYVPEDQNAADSTLRLG